MIVLYIVIKKSQFSTFFCNNMGSCFSKPEDNEKKPVTAKNRFESQQKLGTNGGTQGPSGSQGKRDQGQRLGSAEGTSNNVSAKEAVAKAAEQRYNQQQEKTKDSQGKLEAMKKMSKLDKGL